MVKRFEKHKEFTQQQINKAEKELKNKFPMDVKAIKPKYNYRKTALTLSVVNHGDKTIAIIKVGNEVSDGWFDRWTSDTVQIVKTVNLDFANQIMHIANQFHKLFQELEEK